MLIKNSDRHNKISLLTTTLVALITLWAANQKALGQYPIEITPQVIPPSPSQTAPQGVPASVIPTITPPAPSASPVLVAPASSGSPLLSAPIPLTNPALVAPLPLETPTSSVLPTTTPPGATATPTTDVSGFSTLVTPATNTTPVKFPNDSPSLLSPSDAAMLKPRVTNPDAGKSTSTSAK